MIRIAFLGVIVLAGFLAFGAFSLMRGAGATDPSPPAVVVQQPQEPAAPPAPPPAERVYFLADQDFENGSFALVLTITGDAGQSVVITDPQSLTAAQPDAFFVPGIIESDLAITTDAVQPQHQLAALYHNGEHVFSIKCGATGCGDLSESADVDLAGLLDTAQPLLRIDEIHDTYDAYLDAVAFVNTTPEYAFLGLHPDGMATHPVPQQTPTATGVLPTIYRFTDAPLDIETHTAVLSAVVTNALPQGASLTRMTVTQHEPAIIVDLENNNPATRAGQNIPFDDVLIYTPTFDIEGTATLPDETLESLTEDTLLRVDWEQAAQAFIADLGFPCAECYGVQTSQAVFNRANLTSATPERYALSFYDLRDSP